MNRKAKNDTGVLVVVMVIAAVALYLVYSGGLLDLGKETEKTKETGDLSEGKGAGFVVRFYDKEGNVYESPEWFSIIPPFSIVRKPSPPSCNPTTYEDDCCDGECSGLETCLNNQCVLGGVEAIDITIGVTNSGDVPFDDVYISDASPAAFKSALQDENQFGVGAKVDSLATGGVASWTSGKFNIGSYEGETKTFTAEITATNRYSKTTDTFSPEIDLQLVFQADPEGGLTVLLKSGAP